MIPVSHKLSANQRNGSRRSRYCPPFRRRQVTLLYTPGSLLELSLTQRRDRALTPLEVSMISKCCLLVFLLAVSVAASGADEPYGPELQGFEYPYPVAHFNFPSQRQTLQMAFMDVQPKNPNGRTAVLMHGKNFCAATWRTTIDALTDAGYRVIAPDQIGFCKSTKPERYQYSFQQL